MKKEFKVNPELNQALHKKSIELSGIERLIGFALANTDYTIPEDKLEKLMEKHTQLNAEYEELKSQLSAIITEEFGPTVAWNLDFNSGIAIIE